MYDFLHDYGWLYTFLSVKPKQTSLADFKLDVTIAISLKIGSIVDNDPHIEYTNRISFMDELSKRIKYTKFIRIFYLKCCRQIEEPIGKRKFGELLELLDKILVINREQITYNLLDYIDTED